MRTAIAACLLMTLGPAGLAGEPPPMTAGQTVYVPVYSHVLHGNHDSRGNPGQWLLAAMLSIRNTDPNSPMRILSVRYYDTDGKLIREFPKTARELRPMATTEVFIEHKDSAGGSGANFLVTWQADRPINAPIIETVHTYFFGTQSVAFTSPSQPLHDAEPR